EANDYADHNQLSSGSSTQCRCSEAGAQDSKTEACPRSGKKSNATSRRTGDSRHRKEVVPGATRRVGFAPDKTGTFPFACHVFCGDGHEEMNKTLVVRE